MPTSTHPDTVQTKQPTLARAIADHLTPSPDRTREVFVDSWEQILEDYEDETDASHSHYLRNRGVAPEVAAARGYKIIGRLADWAVNGAHRELSFHGPREFNERLEGIGTFRPLGIPLYSADHDDPVCMQLRPTEPWEVKEQGKDGKAQVRSMKFIQPSDTVRGSGYGQLPADVHPDAREWALDTSIPLLITEGVAKGDAVLSSAWREGIEIAPVSLTGVTMGYRAAGSTDNPGLRPTLVEETLGKLPFDGRVVFLCWDSDWRQNSGVFKPLLTTAGLLAERGAIIRVLDVPALAGPGTGVDDYLAHSLLDHAHSPLADLLQASISGEDAEAIVRDYSNDDAGHGQRLADEMIRLGSHRYNSTAGDWITWDGKRWTPDMHKTAQTLWMSLTNRLLDSTDHRNARSERGIKAAANLAGTHRSLAMKTEDLDQDPYLLNTQNGTVDLHTGNLLPHNPKNLITAITTCGYDPSAPIGGWLSFLNQTFLNDPETVQWIQKLCGMALIGKITSEVLVMFIGSGSNGKSTFLQVVQQILGTEFSGTFPPDALMTGRARDEHYVAFRGKRLMVAAETGPNQILDEATLKRFTSTDQLTARDLYQSRFYFWPSHSMWLASNHVPTIVSQSHSVWRRIVIVPFDNTVTEAERDADLSMKLLAEAPGILAWMVEGARRLIDDNEKLGTCDAVTRATDAQRGQSDLLGEFLAEKCIVGADQHGSRPKLYEAFQMHCIDQGRKAWQLKSFLEALQERNVLPREGYARKVTGEFHLLGLRLRTKQDDLADKIAENTAHYANDSGPVVGSGGTSS